MRDCTTDPDAGLAAQSTKRDSSILPARANAFCHTSIGNLHASDRLAAFVPFAALYMREPVKLNYLRAALCVAGAVYFIFRT